MKRPAGLLPILLGSAAFIPTYSVFANTESSTSSSPPQEAAAALEALEESLGTAHAKAKALGQLIWEAQEAKQTAEASAKSSAKDLKSVRAELDQVMGQLTNMQERENHTKDRLSTLETKLATSHQLAKKESAKLQDTADQLAQWERRALGAEEEWRRAKGALQTSLQVARDAKSQSAKLKDQLAEAQANHHSNSAKLETVNQALERVQKEKTRALETRRQVQERLTQARENLKQAEQKAKQIPQLRNDLAEVKSQLADQERLSALHDKQTTRLRESADRMREQLDIVLSNREELHDRVAILKAELDVLRSESATSHARLERDAEDTRQLAEARINQLEEALEAKEEALQKAYTESKKSAQNAGHLEKALKALKEDLEAPKAKAYSLNERLIQLEALRLE